MQKFNLRAKDLSTLVSKLILGNQPGSNTLGDYRKKLLIGQLCALSIFFTSVYIIVDIIAGSNAIIYIYLIDIGLFAWAFYSNRKGKFETAKIILLFTVLISVYIFGSNNIQNTQAYLLYFPLILLAFTLNGYDGRYFSITFAIIALILYFLDAFTEFSIFPKADLSYNVQNLVTSVNFILSVAGLVYVSYFLTKTYFLSEKKLLFRQRKLNKLTKDLSMSQQRYKLAMIGTNAGLWDWDLLKDRIFHGPKWKEMLGYSDEGFDNTKIDDIYRLVHPDDIEAVQKAVQDHLTKQKPYEMEYRIKKNDDTYEWYYDSGKAIFDANNRPIRMVGSIINVTKRKLAEKKIIKQKNLLEKANAELDRFVYITSHDLKAPLLSIQGLIHLAEISEDKSEVEMCLKMMMERIKGLENFIADIIDYSRNVRIGLIREEIDLKKMIETIYKDLFYLENLDKIDFKILVDEGLTFKSDEKRMNVILKNLIFNAVKYQDFNKEKPTIIVSANEDGNNLLISVKDNGEGINPEIQDKIYDMFYRASEKSSGSGLGLYIVKEMVNKLEGNIELISDQDKGSEFIIKIPIKV